MFQIICLMLGGVGVGYMLRRHSLKIIPRLITSLIWLLLFFLGMEVGCNQRLIHNISTLGVEALLLTLGGILGSILLAWGLWNFVLKKGKPNEG